MASINLFDRIIDLEIKYRAPSDDTEEHDEITEWTNPNYDPITQTYTGSEDAPALLYKKSVEHKDATQGFRTFKITCPRIGRKPSISLHWKSVPGKFCYDCDIVISNLYLSMPAIYAESLVFTAGYRDATNVKISCTVFASYQPQPGPDGTTVFRCIVASSDLALFNDQPYSLEVYHSNAVKFTIRDVLNKLQFELQKRDKDARVIAEPKGDSKEVLIGPFAHTGFNGVRATQLVQFQQESCNPYLERVFAPENFPRLPCKNLYSLVNEIQKEINALLEPDGVKVMTMIFNHTIIFSFLSQNNCLTIFSSEKEHSEYDELVPVLDLVTSVNWNAGVINVTAPWNPDIVPGTVFKMSPKYYSGGEGLPNSVARVGSQADPWDLYWVITQEVTFSTIDENQMQLLAVPFKNSPKRNQSSSYSVDSKISADAMDTYRSLANPIIPIVLGAKDEAEVKSETEVKNLDDLTWNISSDDYTIIQGDTLSEIMEKFSLPPFKGGLPGKGSVYVKASEAWYPIVMVATNTWYKQDKQNRSLYKLNMGNPDDIVPDHRLRIPKGLTWKAIQQQYKTKAIQIFRSCSQFYVQKGKASWAANLEQIASILDEGFVE